MSGTIMLHIKDMSAVEPTLRTNFKYFKTTRFESPRAFFDLQGLIVKLQLTLLNFARLEYFTSTILAQLHRYVAV